MKIAFLIMCHKNVTQVNKMIDFLDDEDIDIYLHIDKKSNMEKDILKRENVYILDDDKRIDIIWGQSGMMHATVNLIEASVSNKKVKYDYYWFISGQDFPIKSVDYIKAYLSKNNGMNYIDVMDKSQKIYKRFLKRNTLKYPKFITNSNIIITILKHFYITITGGPYTTVFFERKNTTGLEFNFGSSWWILTNDTINHMYKKLQNNPCILKYFDNCICPDESLFQSLFMSSSGKNNKQNYPAYIDWRGQNKHPKTLTTEDFNALIESQYLIARKFDENVDNEIINRLYNKLKTKE